MTERRMGQDGGIGIVQRSDSALLFMVKWPQPGRAKTRLCPPLTADEAAGLALAFLLDTLAEAGRTSFDRLLAFAPACAEPSFRALVGPEVGLIEAETADLGAALGRAQRLALAAGYRRVALVASDIPHLDAARYTEAFALLGEADVVIGPSGDGGYYLLAAEQETPALFDGVTWSTSTVHEETLYRAGEAGLTVATIASCDDVDTAADLPWLRDALRTGGGGARTLPLLEPLVARLDGVAAD